MNSQISIFDGQHKFKLTKPIRLITLFSGYDSQALALKYLGVPFEHYRTCEWAIKSIQALKDLHFSDDDTDYSAGMSKEELLKILLQLGVSADYSTPLGEEQLKRRSEQELRKIFNNIKASHNLVSVCNAKGEDLGICETGNYDYIMTYSFPCQDLSNAGGNVGCAKGVALEVACCGKLNDCSKKQKISRKFCLWKTSSRLLAQRTLTRLQNGLPF